MYRWEDDGTQKRIPRKSVALLQHWFQKLPGRVAELVQSRKAAAGAALEVQAA